MTPDHEGAIVDPSTLLTENLSTDGLEFERYEVEPENVVEGSPVVENATLHQSADGRVLVGVARLSGGTQRYRQTADEIDYVKSGRLLITGDDGSEIDARPGSMNRLTKGVTYTKRVIEPYVEFYVMTSDTPFEL
jgi:uncharacterized cupin superfamily protein